MSWVYKGDFGRYLHSFGREYRGQFQDCRWSEHQHDAYRFADRNVAAYVAMRSGEAGTLKRLKPKGIDARLDRVEKTNAEVWTMLEAAFRLLPTLPATQRQGTPTEGGNG